MQTAMTQTRKVPYGIARKVVSDNTGDLVDTITRIRKRWLRSKKDADLRDQIHDQRNLDIYPIQRISDSRYDYREQGVRIWDYSQSRTNPIGEIVYDRHTGVITSTVKDGSLNELTNRIKELLERTNGNPYSAKLFWLYR